MSRRIFFSEVESNILKELVAAKIDIVENKKTDFKATLAKNAAWSQIETEFNSFAAVNKRHEKQLRKCWENMKSRAKKNDAVERRERLNTGGGKAVIPEGDLTSVAALVPSQIKPLKNKFVCDAGDDDESDNDRIESTASHERIAIVEDVENACAGNSGASNVTVKPGLSQEGCKTQTTNNKKRPSTHDTILARQEEEHSMRMKMLRQQIEYNREEHEVKMECLLLKKRKLEEQMKDSSSGADKPVKKVSLTSHKSLFSIH